MLAFTTPPGFSGLARTSCPTFQVDDRLPLHHFEIGAACEVEAGGARYRLGPIRDGLHVSLVTHRLMNGGTVAFRFLTEDGAYHESTFALTRSKRAVAAALGTETRVEPE